MKILKIFGAIISILVIAFLGVRFFSGPEDTWLCQNGQWVKHGNPSAPQPISGCGVEQPSDITVTTPQPNQIVMSPLNIEGQARGNWFFEAVFPVELVDAQGEVIARGRAQAQSDWMTDNFVPFKAQINYQLAATTTGKLILRNDNPSGLPQNEKSFEVPAIISPSQAMTVKAFFNNNNLDPQISCNKVFAVERTVPQAQAVARAALEQLLAGPSESEKAQGYFTSINPGVKIQQLTIDNGTAKVDFNATLENAVGGSCRVSAIRAQISETLKQFSTVKNVIISINRRTEDILQP